MQHQPFDKQAARSRTDFRSEWVTLDYGEVLVREMTVQESQVLAERAARPAIDPRGGLDPGESVLWQVILSCYTSDEPNAERVFSESAEDVKIIMGLRLDEFNRLMRAIARVNGQDPTEAELMRDFTAVREDAAISR